MNIGSPEEKPSLFLLRRWESSSELPTGKSTTNIKRSSISPTSCSSSPEGSLSDFPLRSAFTEYKTRRRTNSNDPNLQKAPSTDYSDLEVLNEYSGLPTANSSDHSDPELNLRDEYSGLLMADQASYMSKFNISYRGKISSEEADDLLVGQPVGTYLFRESISHSGDIVLAYVTNSETVIQKTVFSPNKTNKPRDQVISESNLWTELTDPLPASVQFTPKIIPLQSITTWKMNAENAQTLLLKSEIRIGTFIVRESSLPNHLAITVKALEGKVKHFAYNL
jgi:hypothetical protein